MESSSLLSSIIEIEMKLDTMIKQLDKTNKVLLEISRELEREEEGQMI